MLKQIDIVLSHTTHPGNIGATARAMKVMGLSNLVLINPHNFPSEEASVRASHADDVLDSAKICSSLDEAIANSRLIIGASARVRSLQSKMVTPRDLVKVIQAQPERQPISILFGTENSGLTNEELHHCHYHLFIPTNPEYSSLNLASAVQLIAYELYLAFANNEELPHREFNQNDQVISREQLEGLLTHFEQVMQQTGYLVPEHAKQLDSRMNRLFNKADITISELNILRGFLTSVSQYANRLKVENKKTQIEKT